ncbi:MAG: hypothetical protein KGZ30_04535 [Anaplasmataceae bacterium]|nr:hypothetical protein [Anaplasmataceae bacterium]
MKKLLWLPLLFFPRLALAHCPLCTVGAGFLAVTAASLGVSSIIVGIMIGGFAMALATWLSWLPNKKYITGQPLLLAGVIFLSTVIPIMPLVRDFDPLYLNWWGSYGTPFHNTYAIDLYLLGVLIGAPLILIAPYLSQLLTKFRKGKFIPYQGIIITFLLLLLASFIVQLTV